MGQQQACCKVDNAIPVDEVVAGPPSDIANVDPFPTASDDVDEEGPMLSTHSVENVQLKVPVGQEEDNLTKTTAVSAASLISRPSFCTKTTTFHKSNVLEAVPDEDVRLFFVSATSQSHSANPETPISDCSYNLKVEHLAEMAQALKCSDYSHEALQRVYDFIPKSGGDAVTLAEFKIAVAGGPASTTLRILISRFRSGMDFGFEVPWNYDYMRGTNENYKSDAKTYIGDFVDIRRTRDYSYHTNYTEARQLWQDAAIKSIIGRTERQPAPWLVYTCGPMGVGKGFALDWMSRQGFFPLEHIVHIDPDGFKLMMPEWANYVSTCQEEAGTLCHMESCFMMEVAREAAMLKRQNIWVDGSLRNAEFYSAEFTDIRIRFPHYKIAIFYVTAPETTIRERIAARAAATGRHVPEHLIQGSLKAMDHSLNVLTPLCDFVARISNAGRTPILSAFETVNTCGSWQVIADRFARRTPDSSEFPNALAPFVQERLPDDQGVWLSMVGKSQKVQLTWEVKKCPDSLKRLWTALPKRLELRTSPLAPITFGKNVREEAHFDREAVFFCWIYPHMCNYHEVGSRQMMSKGCTKADLRHPIMNLLQRGGFAYLNKKGRIIQVRTTTSGDSGRGDEFLQFGPLHVWPDGVPVPENRLRLPPRRYREAESFAWFNPGEMVNGVSVGLDHGSFCFCLEESRRAIIFPVIA